MVLLARFMPYGMSRGGDGHVMVMMVTLIVARV